MQTKWKNIKQSARKREALRRKTQIQTGGGKLTQTEQRIVDSVLYADIALKMGASATGNTSRFDSDSTNAVPSPPTNRLSNAIVESEESRMSFDSDSMLFSATSIRQNGDNDYDMNDTVVTASHKKASIRTKSISNSSESLSRSTTPIKNIRDVRAEATIQLSEFLTKNNENNELHSQLLRQQIDREELSKQCASAQVRKSEAEARKAEFELKKAKIGCRFS